MNDSHDGDKRETRMAIEYSKQNWKIRNFEEKSTDKNNLN